MKRVGHGALVLLAAAGGVAAFAWATGLIEIAASRPDDVAEPDSAAEVPSGAHDPKPSRQAAQPSSGGESPARVARYAVCGREEAVAQLYMLSARPETGALWAVSCGSTTHVMAIEAEQGIVLARRVARLRLPSPAPDRAPRPAPIALAAADATWLVATMRVDRNGSPAGGALFRMPLEAGDLLGTASRVHDAAPGALALATLDRAPGTDFALLSLGDPRVAQSGELWLFSGGAAPTRIARRNVEPDAFALAATDLDGDENDELAVLARSGRVTVHASSDQVPPVSATVPGSDGVYALDVDGDGKREVVASGPQAHVLRLDGNGAETNLRQLTAAPLPALDGVRDLVAIDVDADGRNELAGYAHPHVVALRTTRDAGPRRALFELSGEGFAVLTAVPAQLDGDGRIDLIALIASENNDPQIELVIATQPPDITEGATRIRVPNGGNELRNAPLVRDLELR